MDRKDGEGELTSRLGFWRTFPTRAAREWRTARFWWSPAMTNMRTMCGRSRRRRWCGRGSRTLPGTAWRGGRSGSVPQWSLGVGLHDGYKVEDGAATFLGHAEVQGDRGGEASELEVLGSSRDCSPELRLATARSWRALVRLGFGKRNKKRRRGADAKGFIGDRTWRGG
jgi:hypothetical protein